MSIEIINKILEKASKQAAETHGTKQGYKTLFISFGEKYGNESLAKEIIQNIAPLDEYENVDRDFDENLRQIGGAFFYALFLTQMKEQIERAGIRDTESESALKFSKLQEFETLISISPKLIDNFLNIIDSNQNLSELQKLRFSQKLRTLSVEALHIGIPLEIKDIKIAICEVGNNIFIEENFPES